MKYLVVALVVLAGFWLWRHQRSAERREAREEKKRRAPPPGVALEMAECKACGLHLPRADALHGRDGLYCSDEHRRRHEG